MLDISPSLKELLPTVVVVAWLLNDDDFLTLPPKHVPPLLHNHHLLPLPTPHIAPLLHNHHRWLMVVMVGVTFGIVDSWRGRSVTRLRGRSVTRLRRGSVTRLRRGSVARLLVWRGSSVTAVLGGWGSVCLLRWRLAVLQLAVRLLRWRLAICLLGRRLTIPRLLRGIPTSTGVLLRRGAAVLLRRGTAVLLGWSTVLLGWSTAILLLGVPPVLLGGSCSPGGPDGCGRVWDWRVGNTRNHPHITVSIAGGTQEVSVWKVEVTLRGWKGAVRGVAEGAPEAGIWGSEVTLGGGNGNALGFNVTLMAVRSSGVGDKIYKMWIHSLEFEES